MINHLKKVSVFFTNYTTVAEYIIVIDLETLLLVMLILYLIFSSRIGLHVHFVWEEILTCKPLINSKIIYWGFGDSDKRIWRIKWFKIVICVQNILKRNLWKDEYERVAFGGFSRKIKQTLAFSQNVHKKYLIQWTILRIV